MIHIIEDQLFKCFARKFVFKSPSYRFNNVTFKNSQVK